MHGFETEVYGANNTEQIKLSLSFRESNAMLRAPAARCYFWTPVLLNQPKLIFFVRKTYMYLYGKDPLLFLGYKFVQNIVH
jgi:hypothetical protein